MSGPIRTTAFSSTTRATSGSAATAARDSHILKFTKDGKFLMQVGKKGARRKAGAAAGEGEGDVAGFVGGSNDQVSFGRVAKIFVDAQANEAYIADGYLNKRVAVLDADTGKMKRYWGAYGNKPDDTPLPAYDPSAPPAQQFRNPVHCADHVGRSPALCLRSRRRPAPGVHARGQVRQGSVLREEHEERGLGLGHRVLEGSAAALHLHGRRREREGARSSTARRWQELTTFGDGGRQPGQFYGVHSIATDSKGNIYTTETYEGKRLQQFVCKGMAPVTSDEPGQRRPGLQSK